MALARIITRSELCSRELSLALVARGYTVEVVTPDKVPDNTADLELRVEAGPENGLVANVEAHDGGQTKSLEFVHHLKAPVLDFPRRPLEHADAARLAREAVGSIAREGSEVVARPALGPQPSLSAVALAVEILPRREADLVVDPPESLPTVPQVLTAPEAAPAYLAVESAIVLESSQTIVRAQISTKRTIVSRLLERKVLVSPAVEAHPRHRSAGWQWTAGLAFVFLVLLGVTLGFDMRGSGRAAEIQTVPWQLPGADMQTYSSSAPRGTQPVKRETLTATPKRVFSRKHGDDLIARDTTVYFDKRFEPAAKVKRAKSRAH